jgi:DNA-binding GntR family transcriptional regulator
VTQASGTTAEAGDERLPLAESAYRILKRRILDNELPPGTIMLELEVASMLNMSRTPAREAMVRLADEGLVDVRPRHGMRVLPISADDMREIYSVLTALESEAAEWVARDGVSEARLQDLRGAVAEMEASLERDDLAAWAAADEQFHRFLVDSCGNARLRALILQFWDQSHRVRMATLRLRPRPVDSNRDHLALVEAIADRDPERARTIHRHHRKRHGEMLAGLLDPHRGAFL